MTTTNTTSKKLTKRDHLNALLAISANADHFDFIKHELELLDRKNTTERKPTAKQVANANLAEQILTEMEPGVLYTVSEAMKSLPCLSADPAMTNQRASRVMNDLVKSGDLVKTTEKRKSYFTLPQA